MFKTTKENLSDRKQTIILGDLPKTFRDAVEITRALKKRYLWIDSLCIIQNDGQDWQQEGLRMHEIYGNAYLTIVASKNRGPDEGLFSESPHHRLQDFSFTRDGGQHSVLRVRRKVQHFNSADAFPPPSAWMGLPGADSLPARATLRAAGARVGMHGGRGV
jgi:hypothetical protein